MTRKPTKRVQAEKRDLFIALPMVEKSRSDGKAGRNFWAVKRTGDYGLDCALGQGIAKVTGDASARDELADTLRSAIIDMVRQGEISGVEVGFLSTITRAAARGW